jgi:hypothetical protein
MQESLVNSLEATARVIKALETLDIDYLLVGALSSNAYGIARATKDADIVVAYRSGILGELMDLLGREFRLDRQMRFETITNSVRNVITYLPTRFDIELFRLSEDDHHAERFRRRCRREIGELACEAWIPSAEDVIIQKLRWQRRRDIDDAKNVLAVRFTSLDWEYLEHWTTIHGTLGLLHQLRDELPDLDLLDEDD